MSASLKSRDGNEHNIGKVLPPIECFRCGICCISYQPKLTSEDAENIARGLAISPEEVISRYAQYTHAGYLLRQSGKGCVFLLWEEDNLRASCSIYPFRPEACRNWVPSLSHSECQEGLARLKTSGKIKRVKEKKTENSSS